MEERPAFPSHEPTNTTEMRDGSPQAQTHQESIRVPNRDNGADADHQVNGNHPSGFPTVDQPVLIEDMVARVVLHESRPIENLPKMISPELKLIGRCVTFQVKRSPNGAPGDPYYYTGLVSAVTANTATLMHVNRYTQHDFKTYQSREQRLAKGKVSTVGKDRDVGNHRRRPFDQEPTAPSSGLPAPSTNHGLSFYGYSADGEVGVAEDGGISNALDPPALLDLHASGSLAPSAALITDTQLYAVGLLEQEQQQQPRRNHTPVEVNQQLSRASGVAWCKQFRAFVGSIGPIPYVTFLRKNIHNVEFGRDPCSSFYSLFKDPARHIRDMQVLRMFVRRYLVHTSQGNNPRQVLLYAFLSVRCAWPDVDRELVNRVALEELPTLLKADCAIEKERRRKLLRVQYREQEVQHYRAPAGLFSNTGILYLTNIPQHSFIAGIVLIVFALLFAIYLGVVFGTTKDAIIVSYVRKFILPFVISLVTWTVAGAAVMLHARTAHIPLLADYLGLGLRIVGSVASIGCCIMTLLVVFWRLTKEAIYLLMVEYKETELCTFYARHSCTGLFVACGLGAADPELCLSCTGMPVTNTNCYSFLWTQIERAVVPLLLFSCVIMVAAVYTTYLVVKMLLFVEVLMGRIM
uniref:Transmembrane protein n=1 Tax=Leishmania guyanensis TaxID=5670 RepID=A0A1E1J2N5_LEIGU|nr:hypothetical protein, conserved [Leishmania guyanensis]